MPKTTPKSCFLGQQLVHPNRVHPQFILALVQKSLLKHKAAHRRPFRKGPAAILRSALGLKPQLSTLVADMTDVSATFKKPEFWPGVFLPIYGFVLVYALAVWELLRQYIWLWKHRKGTFDSKGVLVADLF